MATKKDLFDDAKKDELLKDAVQKAKKKKGEKFPFVFGMKNKEKEDKGDKGKEAKAKKATAKKSAHKDEMCVIDFKRQNDVSKMFLMMKGKFRQVIMGQVIFITGDSIEVQVAEEKGGKIKPKSVKDCLRPNGVKKVKLVASDGTVETAEDEV